MGVEWKDGMKNNDKRIGRENRWIEGGKKDGMERKAPRGMEKRKKGGGR